MAFKMTLVSSDENRLVSTKNLSFLPKFTTEKFKSTWKAAGKRTSGLRDIGFHRKLYSRRLRNKRSRGRGKKILYGLCFRRQRNSKEPHKLSLKCESEDKGIAKVVQKSCSYFYGVVTFGRPHFELISVNPHAQD